MSVLSLLALFTVVVGLHEMGHFLTARRLRVAVKAFSLGIGPVIARRRGPRGVEWRLSLIPLGGYVMFSDDAPPGEFTLADAPPWRKALIIAAGPVVNLVLAILLLAALFMHEGKPSDPPVVESPLAAWTSDLRAGDVVLGEAPVSPGRAAWTVRRNGSETVAEAPSSGAPVVTGVMPSMHAWSAGVRPGDLIVAIDGRPVLTAAEVSGAVSAKVSGAVSLDILRDGSPLRLDVRVRRVPSPEGGRRGMIGVTQGGAPFVPATVPVGPAEAGAAALRWAGVGVTATASSLRRLITGETCGMGGPLTIYRGTASASEMGVSDMLRWSAMISLMIGLMNLLPVPGLDGGHLVASLSRMAGIRVSPRVVTALEAAGLALIGTLMALGLLSDLVC